MSYLWVGSLSPKEDSMIPVLACVVIGVVLAALFTDWGYDGAGGLLYVLLGAFIGFLVGGFVALIIGASMPYKLEVAHNYQLVALQGNAVPQGTYYLESGQAGGDVSYYYSYQDSGGAKSATLSSKDGANYITIIESASSEQASLVVVQSVFADSGDGLWGIPIGSQTYYVFHLPPGSFLSNFTLGN